VCFFLPRLAAIACTDVEVYMLKERDMKRYVGKNPPAMESLRRLAARREELAQVRDPSTLLLLPCISDSCG